MPYNLLASNMNNKHRNILKLLARILAATVLLGWVFSKIDLQQLMEVLASVQWEFFGALWVLVIILFLIQALKMKLILAKQGCCVGVGRLFSLSAITAFYGMFIPGILSTGVKWYILKKVTGKGVNVLSAMLYNQLSMMMIMPAFGLAAIIIDNPTLLLLPDAKNIWLLPFICGVLLAALILTSLLLLNRRTSDKVIKVLTYALSPCPIRVRRKAEQLLRQIAKFQDVGYRFHITVVLITIVGNLGGAVAVYALSAAATNIVVPLKTLIWLTAVIFILGRLPISVANLGVREVTLVGILPMYGVETSAALLMSMIVFSAAIFRAIIGAVCQLFWTVSTKKSNPMLNNT